KFFHPLTVRKLKQRENNNPMKKFQPSLLLVLSLAAASAYAQSAKSSPATGASASPSTPPTRFFSGETERPWQRLQGCAHIWRASEAYRCVQLSHLVADYGGETTGYGQRR